MKSVRLIFHAFRDLIIRHLPTWHKKGGFAFIVHPRNIPDVYRKYPFLKFLSSSQLNWFLAHFWPVIISEIEGLKDRDGKKVKGWVVTISLTPKQMAENRPLAQKKIFDAVVLAEKMGANFVGLGALTASLTRGGLDISEKARIGITTGRALTVYVVTGTALAAIDKFGLDLSEVTVGIVGAAGGVGNGCSKLLFEKGVRKFILIDVDKKIPDVENLVNEIKSKHGGLNASFVISNDIKKVIDADLLITATNAPQVVIKSEHLKPGAIIINDAQPSDVSPEVYGEREDVLILEGGLINTPGINYHFNFGLANREDSFCCLGEVMSLAHENWDKHYALGYLDMGLIDKVATLSKKLNFRLANFQNFVEGEIKQDKIDKIQKILSKNGS